jgi:Fe-S-cluster-containing dehydrogenase component
MSSKSTSGGVRYGMVIDVDKCTGCGACSVACMSENNIGVLPDETDKIRSITWLRVYQIDNKKPYPDTQIAFFPSGLASIAPAPMATTRPAYRSARPRPRTAIPRPAS